jgi:tetratricopeptide (TPR) repeat protein
LGLILSNLFFFFFIGKKNLLANKTKTIITIVIIIGISVFFNIKNEESVIGRFMGDIKPSSLDSKQSPPYQKDTEIAPSLLQDFPNEDIGVVDQLGGTMRLRVFQYLTGLKIIHDYPILGIGPDTLGMIYPKYLSKVFKEKDEHRYLENKKTAERVHSDFLDMTVSRGLLGLGVYVWFLFAYARMVWRGHRKANNSDKLLIMGLCAGCLAYFVQNQFSFGHMSIITPFWFLIAMSVIACTDRYPLSNGNDFLRHFSPDYIRNSIAYEPAGIKRIGSLSSGKFVKNIFCGITVCLMVLLIILSLYRYKADLYYENGRQSLYKKEIPEAVQSYEMAVKYNPLTPHYRNTLSRIYLDMAVIGISKGLKSTAEGQTRIYSREQTTMWITNAIAGAEKVQKLYPDDYPSAFTLGRAYHLLDKTSGEDTSKDAIKYYKKATMLRPFKLKFRNTLAQLYAEKGQFENAIPELKEAINISPGNQAIYLNLANVYMNDNERDEEAEAVLLEFINKNPDQEIIDIYLLLNSIYLKEAKWEKALKYSKKIIQLDQENLNAHKNVIMANLKLERYDDARNYCNLILDLSGSQNNTYSKYAKEILARLSEK